jgi:hypothetical protein
MRRHADFDVVAYGRERVVPAAKKVLKDVGESDARVDFSTRRRSASANLQKGSSCFPPRAFGIPLPLISDSPTLQDWLSRWDLQKVQARKLSARAWEPVATGWGIRCTG